MGAFFWGRLVSLSVFGIALIGSPGYAQQPGPSIKSVRVASGLTQPVFVLAAPGEYHRVFIVQRTGQIHVLYLRYGQLTAVPFFNIESKLLIDSGEQGLLGMAFDPDFASNGKFYLNFTAPGGVFGSGITHVSQFSTPSTEREKRDRITPEKILLTVDQPQANHNGGWIGFSPRSGDRHNLYIALGDGGAGNDQGTGHIEPGGNAQSIRTLLGKIVRIHVNPDTGSASIPPNNPFVGTNSNITKAIWVLGLRNPFRCSFDRHNGRMFIGDVGQSTREEINVQQANNARGADNYEWRMREGSVATPTGNPVVGGAKPPGGDGPLLDYGRSIGGTVIGGYMYRGRAIPGLRGKYVFGDFVSSKFFNFDYNGRAFNFRDDTFQIFPNGVPSGFALSSFGEDGQGEIYFTDVAGGAVYKIVPGP